MEKGQEIFNIGISGSYGGFNLGDEAILQMIIEQIKTTVPASITVFSRNAQDTKNRHQVENVVPVREITKKEINEEVTKLDIFILGGGGILYDQEAQIYLREVELALEANIPVFVYAISAGPLTDAHIRKSVANCLNKVSCLTVRDRQAKHLLEDIGVTKHIEVTADPALLLRPEPLPELIGFEEILNGRKKIIGISIREPGPAAPDIDPDHYNSLLSDVADFVIDRYNAFVVFVPMERVKDIQPSHAVISKMQNAQFSTVLKDELTPGQTLTLISRFDFVIGMRLHFLIFAAISGVPFIPLPYAGKVKGFIETLGLEMPPLSEVTSGRLLAYIDASWDKQKQLKNMINQKVPKLKERAHYTHELLLQLIKKQTHTQRFKDAHSA